MSGVPARLKIVIVISHPWSRRPYQWEIWDIASGRPIHSSYARFPSIRGAHSDAMVVLLDRWGGSSGNWATYQYEYKQWTCAQEIL